MTLQYDRIFKIKKAPIIKNLSFDYIKIKKVVHYKTL